MLVLPLNRFRQSKIGVFRQGEKENKVNKKKISHFCFSAWYECTVLVLVHIQSYSTKRHKVRTKIRFFLFGSTSRFCPNAFGAQLDFLVHYVFL